VLPFPSWITVDQSIQFGSFGWRGGARADEILFSDSGAAGRENPRRHDEHLMNDEGEERDGKDVYLWTSRSSDTSSSFLSSVREHW